MSLTKKLIMPLVAAGVAISYGSLAQADHINNEAGVVQYIVDNFGSDLKSKDEGIVYALTNYSNDVALNDAIFTKLFTTDYVTHGDWTEDTKLYATIDEAVHSSEYDTAYSQVEKVEDLRDDLIMGVALMEIDLNSKDMIRIIAVKPDLTTFPLGDLKGNFQYNPITTPL